MKHLMLVVMLLLATPAHFAQSELSDSDLQRIREIIRAEIKTELANSETRMKAEIVSSETRMKEYVDTKFEAVDAKFKAVDAKIEAVNAKIEAVATRVNDLAGYLNATNMLFGGMVALIVAGIGIPKIILALRARRQDRTQVDTQQPRDELTPTQQQYAQMQKEQAETRAVIQQLREEIQLLKQQVGAISDSRHPHAP